MKKDTGLPRWQAGVPAFILAVAVANTVLYHAPLLGFARAHLDLGTTGGLLTLATLFFLASFITALVLAGVALVSVRLLKPVCMVAALGNSVALYFIQAYGVILDRAMMGNVLNTNPAEAGDLFHPKVLAYLLVLGVLPCLLLARFELRPLSWPRRAGIAVAVLAAGLAWAYGTASTWLWIDEHAKRLGGMTLPWSYFINGPRHLASQLQPREQQLLPAARFTADTRPVVILVIGEAARAQDFSLYGYARPTNPLLTANGVTALKNARSCTTYTTASIACMLSHRDGWSLAGAFEPLPSYLQRHGVDVVWRSNNWGEPPLAVGTFERAGELRPLCAGEGCAHDEVLLTGLEQRIRASTQDRVFVVLHQMGSHGPAYHARYPESFEVFKPVCKSVELSRCTGDELVNAYDNTIVYNDHVLDRTIAILKAFPDRPTALIYLSDHGESLGEFGLYLHGTPYSIAPDVQKDIPFLVWTSDGFRKALGLPPGPLPQAPSHSQSNVFHSVMGAFGMRSAVYDPALDIFAGNPATPNR